MTVRATLAFGQQQAGKRDVYEYDDDAGSAA